MYPRFLPLLCSPLTGKDLKLEEEIRDQNGEIISGTLITDDRSETYPIVNGIPRFANEAYTASFGYEWTQWPKLQFESENKGQRMEGYTQKMFDTVTQFTHDETRDKLIIEFGCGPGRFLDRVLDQGGIAIGLEMSRAVDVAKQNLDSYGDRVLLVQGDVLNPPFKQGSIDHGYTIGVLHHTPNPAQGLKELAELVKPGGKVVCRVYSSTGFYSFPIVQIARATHKILDRLIGRTATHTLYKGYAYFSAYFFYLCLQALRLIPWLGKRIAHVLEHWILINVNLPEARWRLLDVFDASTPYYASTHSADEIRNWYQQAGIPNPRDIKGGNTFIGIK